MYFVLSSRGMVLGHCDLDILLKPFFLHLPLTTEVQPWFMVWSVSRKTSQTRSQHCPSWILPNLSGINIRLLSQITPDHWFPVYLVNSSRCSSWPFGNIASFNTISLFFFHSIIHRRNWFYLFQYLQPRPGPSEVESLDTNVCNSFSTFPCNLLAYCATPNIRRS